MKTLSRLTFAALAGITLAAVTLDAAVVRAAERSEPSAKLSTTTATAPTVEQTLIAQVPETLAGPGPQIPITLALAEVTAPARVEFAGVRYLPRSRSRGNSYSRQPESSGVSQVHVGFFDPDGDQSSRFDIGIRGGPMLDENVQLGLGVDWIHKAENISSVTTTSIGPGGVPIEVKQDIARASVNMFPIMGYIQLSAPADMGIVPYFGAGGGYQVLALSGDDFTTGQSFEGTFSGWGWQLWGGAGIPMSGRTRLTGEVFVNGAELGRDVTDDATGQKVHETVNADGMGMRFGIAWGF